MRTVDPDLVSEIDGCPNSVLVAGWREDEFGPAVVRQEASRSEAMAS